MKYKIVTSLIIMFFLSVLSACVADTGADISKKEITREIVSRESDSASVVSSDL